MNRDGRGGRYNMIIWQEFKATHSPFPLFDWLIAEGIRCQGRSEGPWALCVSSRKLAMTHAIRTSRQQVSLEQCVRFGSLFYCYRLALFLSPCLFPLHLVHEIKVGLVESMHPHVPVFPSTCVCRALRVNCYGVKRSEMAPNSTNLVFEDLVVETGFEFALTCGGGCYIHGCLATS